MVTATRTRLIIPGYHQGFARSAGESDRHQDWKGLVGLWLPTLGPSGTTLRDWSGFRNHGILTSMDPATDWVIDGGSVLDFDGSNDHIFVADPANDSLDFGTESFSVGMRFKPSSVGTKQRLIVKATATGFSINMQATTNKLRGAIADGTDLGESVTTATVSNGVWVDHYMVVDREVQLIKLYINGQEAAYDSQDDITAVGSVNVAEDLAIATRPDTLTEFFAGKVSQVRINKGALTDRHIRQIYQDPLGIVRLRRQQAGTVGLVMPNNIQFNNRDQNIDYLTRTQDVYFDSRDQDVIFTKGRFS